MRKLQGDELVKKAVKAIKAGNLVIYPTETVYGIGADAFSKSAIVKVYEVKGRDFRSPISVAVSDYEMLEEVAIVETAEEEFFIKQLLPGPVTLLLRRRPSLPDILTGGSELVGVRLPEHELARKIINATGPITSTSANISGRKPPTRIEEVDEGLRREIHVVIDGGISKYGKPSTVVDLKSKKIIRRGAGYGKVLHLLQREAR
ncbi:MAG: threonylcarbamoyl-AMP synthase [Candidatus Alkanophagales archaeon]|nr:MAG: threonylcarbamoyl-AMP synthase [Candidatus Alkanophagales archaeon]